MGASEHEVVTSDPWADIAHTVGGALTSADQAAVGNPQWEQTPQFTKRWYEGEDRVAGMLGAMKKLKAQNPNLEIALSIGGWSLSEPFSRMAKDPRARKVFVDSVVRIFDNYSFFSQVDIDWEYPGGGGADNNSSHPEDGKHYQLLVQELRSALNKKHQGVKIAIAAAAPTDKIDASNIKALVDNGVDVVHLMTYDFFGTPWAEGLNHHANTFPSHEGQWSTDTSVKYLINNLGIPANAIHIGYATYSRNARNAEITNYSPLTGTYTMPNDGKYVGGSYEAGIYEWYDFEQYFASITESGGFKIDKLDGYKLYTDKKANADYIYNKDNRFFMSMDTPRTAYMKGRYVKEMGLGGIFTWMGDYDNGYMLNAAREGLGYQSTGSNSNIDMSKIIFTCGENIQSAEECASLTKLSDEAIKTTQAHAGDDVTAELKSGVAYQLDGSGSTSAAGELRYQWVLTASQGIESGDINLKDSNQQQASFTITNLSGASRNVHLAFTLTITDDKGVKSTDSVDFELVGENAAPVAIIKDVEPVVRGNMFILDGSSSYDPDEDALTYQWEQTRGQKLPLAGSGTLSRFSVSTDSLKNIDQMLEYKLTVSDGALSNSDAVVVEVRADAINNQLPIPVVSIQGDLKVGNTLTLDGSKSTDDGEITGYLWSVEGPDGKVAVVNDAHSIASFVPEQEGSYDITLRVIDNLGASKSAAETVEVKAGGSCGSDPDAGNYAPWEAKVYSQSGTKVSHNNLVWQNRWYASASHEPGRDDVWELVSDIAIPSVSSKAYYKGETVTHNGYKWRATQWSQNNEPGSSRHWEKIEPSSC